MKSEIGNSYNSTTKSTTNDNNVMKIIIEIIVLHMKICYMFIEAFVKLFVRERDHSVNNKVILITGTGHGIGKEVALQYAKLGAKILCLDINEKTNGETVKEIKAFGGIAYGYTCDVTKRLEVFELETKLKREHGFIDIIINNAGIMPTHPLLQQNEDEIKLTFDVNVLSQFWILQAFLPNMLKRNEGHVVALSSVAGLFGTSNLVPYCGSKFAVRGLMLALAKELRTINRENNIKLTTIYPYMVDTGLCKRPHYRFNWLKLVSVKDAAAGIIKAQRTCVEECCIPSYYLIFERMNNILPRKVMQILMEYIDAGVYSDL